MDNNFINQAFMGLLSLVIGILHFGVKSFKADHEKLKERHNDLALDVSKNYSSKVDLNSARNEFTSAISRVHERLDEFAKSQDKKSDIIIELLKK